MNRPEYLSARSNGTRRRVSTSGIAIVSALLLVVTLLAMPSAEASAPACTDTWTNAAGGNWSDPANWDHGAPAATDSACITAPGTYTVTLDSTNWEVASLTLGDGSASFPTLLLSPHQFESRNLRLDDDSAIASGATLTLTHDAAGGSGASVLMSAGKTITNDGAIRVLTGGGVGESNSITANIDNTATGVVDVEASTSYAGTLSNAGTVSTSVGATWTMINTTDVFTQTAGTLSNAGGFRVGGSLNFSGGSVSNNPIELTGGTLTFPATDAGQSGVVNVTSNSASIAGNVPAGVEVRLFPSSFRGVTLNVSSSLTNNGTITLTHDVGGSNGSSLAVAAGTTLTNNGTLRVLSGGGVGESNNISGTIDNTASGVLDIEASTSFAGSLSNAGSVSTSIGATWTMVNTTDVFTQTSGTLSNAGGFRVGGGVNFSGGSVSNNPLSLTSGTLTFPVTDAGQTGGVDVTTNSASMVGTVPAGVDVRLFPGSFSGTTLNVPSSLTNEGTITLSDDPGDFSGSTLAIAPGQTLTNNGTIRSQLGAGGGTNNYSITGEIENADGTLEAGSSTVLDFGSGVLDNWDTPSHVLGGGTYNALGTLRLPITGSIVTNNASILVAGGAIRNASNTDPLPDITNSSGSISLVGSSIAFSGDFLNAGHVVIEGGGSMSASSYTQSGVDAITVVNQPDGAPTQSTLIAPTIALNGGELGGNGTLNGNVSNNGALVTPELIDVTNTPDTLTIGGNYTQGSGGAITALVAGDTSFSQLAPSGTVSLNGTLNIQPDPGYDPTGGTQFRVLSSGALPTGTFATVNGGSFAGGTYDVTYDANGVLLTVTTVPDAPTNVSASVDDSQTTVTFNAPTNDGGSPITGYTVTAHPHGAADASGDKTATDTASPITVTGLTNGTQYDISVVATNAIGNSAAGISTVTPIGRPGAPTNVTAGPADSAAVVGFNAPADDGGSPITSYTATAHPHGAADTSGDVSKSAAHSPIILTGLTNATLYDVSVVATNAIGDGPAGTTTVTPAGSPSAPTSVSATVESGQTSVSFTAPTDDGGSAVTDYRVVAHPHGDVSTSGDQVGTGTASPILVTGLTNGTLYDISVVASNCCGTSPAGTTTVTPVGLPGAPTGVSASVADSQSVVSFTAPADNGGSAITGYTVTAHPHGAADTTGDKTATGPGSPITVTGLTNGTQYDVSVVATNAVGNGPAGSASVTPVAVPGAPTGVSASVADSQSVVSFTAPVSSGGSAITGYTVRAHPHGAVDATGDKTASGSASPITVTGLTNGTTYDITVVATNAVGDGPAGTASVTPMGVPGAPTGVSATVASGQTTVSFTAPTDNGGSAITGYTVTAHPHGAADTTGDKTGTGSNSPITVTGLTNGTQYDVSVVATNAVGDGPAGTTSVTPVGLPGAPTGVSASVASSQTTVSFTAPADNGGSAITGYTVTAHPHGAADTTGDKTATGSGSPIAVTDLTNGTTYDITVVATNAAGDGPAGVTTVTPVGVPGAPTGVSASVADGQSVVSFTAPTDNGGSAITGYTVTAHPHGALDASGDQVASGATSPITVTGLINGTQYDISVVAHNAVGDGPTGTTTVTPVGLPGAPTGVSASVADSQSVVSFTAPADDGGSAITSYTVTAHPHGAADATGDKTANGSTSPVTVAGLTNGTQYDISVVAHNAVGDGPAGTTSVTPLGVPGAPSSVSATVDNAQSQVSFTAPTDDGGSAISGYTVTAHPHGALDASGDQVASGATSPITVTGLINGTQYDISVIATNAVGNGPAGTTTVTPVGPPGTPTGVSASAGDTQSIVSFGAPASDGGSAITGYTVTAHPHGVASTSGDHTASGPASPITVTGLTNGTQYDISVVATNTIGDGPAGTTTVTPIGVPGAPTGVSATVADAHTVVSFTPPIGNGGSAITGYTVTAHPHGVVGLSGDHTASGPASPITVSGLTNGTTYDITVVAHNAAGDGPGGTTTVTPVAPPGPPTAVSASVDSGQTTVSFAVPASDGGSPITGYTVTAHPHGALDASADKTATGTDSPITVTGLTNGTLYDISVVAHNAIGDGPAGTTSVRSAGVPSAPTDVAAAASSTQAIVTFTAPASDGGSSITGYTVTAHPSGASDAAGDKTSTGAASPITVTGLTNGTLYDISVVAHNAIGDGPAGTTTVTPVAPPPPPPPPPPSGKATDSHADGVAGPGDPIGTAGDASPDNPIVTMVEPSTTGPVVINEGPADGGDVPSGWSVIGQHVTITAPAGSADSPLIVTFRIDSSVLPVGEDIDTISIFRDGERAEPCGAAGADPGFCIASIVLDGGDLVVVVHTEHASMWDIGVPASGSIDAACATVTATATFADVAVDSVHRAAIDCLVAWDVVHGLDASHFGPDHPVTRGQAASFLDRLLRSSGVVLPDGPDAFVDDNGSVHEAAIDRLAAAGVINGVDATHFQPDGAVSRAQMASLIERAYELVTDRSMSGAPDAFTDDSGSVHELAINEVAELGIAKGVGGGRFDPTSPVRRDQMASFVARLLSRFVAEGHAQPLRTAAPRWLW